VRTALTARQREVLEFIRGFMSRMGYPPTVREIGAHFGFVPRSIFDHLKALERKGYLRRTAAKSRSLQIVDAPAGPSRAAGAGPMHREIPVLGRVAAGQPLLAEQNVDGALAVPAEWVSGDDAFLLKVQGDSMIEAHILPGDHALVRRQATAETGDIVVAMLNDEATVKRILFKLDEIILQPAHPTMPPIHVKKGEKSFQVLGKVVGILRKI
jgi:repressor LexA